ncbi:MAG: PAS domain S-box protein, partial [Desulfobacteraceae bacterium]
MLDGEPCIQVVCRDVTQRVQMERELKKERDTLEKVISLNPIPIFLYDQEGRYVRGNQAYLDLFGAVPPPDYCFFEDPVLIRAGFQDALNKLKNGSPTQIDEVWYNARDVDAEAPDRSLCLSFSGFPVYSEERLISYVCMLRDITAQKIAQEELRISEEKFSKAFHSSPMIMVVTRLHDGKLIDFNEAFERFIGSNRDGLLGKTSLEVGLWERPEDRKRFVDALLRGDLPLQSIIRRRSGERRVGRFFGERLTIGRETCLLAVIEDITEQLESEEALRLSQESYRQLFDSVTELISVHDPENGAILDVNRAWVDTMGYTKEEVLGKGLEIISCEKPPYTVKNALKGFANARKEGFKATECLTKTKDGRLVWNEVALKPASIGGRESIIAVVRNITERKAMEAQLNREREMLEHIIDMNPYAIAFYDHEGRLFRTNEAFNQLYHTSSFRNYSLFEDPVLAGQGYKESLRALREGQPVSIPSFRDNPRWRREDLPDIPKTLRGVAFPVRPFDNAPATYVAMIEDLTELDSTRNALEESNKKYRSVLENSNDGIVLLQGGSVRYANPKISAMIGVPVRDLLNRPFVDCIPSQDSAHILKLVQARDDQESGAATIETSLVQRDGLRVDVEITTNTIPFEGESAHLVVFRDITERKIYEKRIYQGQKMEAIGTLAGGIAHDFNNILTPILGFTEMTMSGLDPKEKPYQDLGQVLKAGQRAQDLVKQILAFSRQRTYEKKPFQVAPLVAEVTKLLRASLPTTIDIKVDLPRNIRPIIADPTGVHQILMNLCTNAYHAMRDQGGVLSLIFEETEVVPGTKDEWGDTAPGVYLRMAVCDTGHGMEKDVLDKIFHPYFTTKPEGEGTGMGLGREV